METKKFNVNDFYIKDVAYELNSHPDYIFKENIDIRKPKKYEDYETTFINLLESPKIFKNYFQHIETIKQQFSDMFNLNMNEIINIFFFINNTAEEEKPLLILGIEDFNESDYNFIDIQQKIQSFKDDYKYYYDRKKSFRDLIPVELDGPHIALKTLKLVTTDNIQLNELFNNIKVSENFPLSTYYSYLKVHSSVDKYYISQLTSNFETNSYEIILYYLFNKKKPEDYNSYIPININYKNKKCNATIKMNEYIWNNIKSDFLDSFDQITFSGEKVISQEGSFFLFNENINYSILSYICLNMSNDYIIKNERSSLKGNYKLMYKIEDLTISIKNNNITGSIEEKKMKILSDQPLDTKYLQISFKSKNNNLNLGDISCIKKYVGQLLTMYNDYSSVITTLYKDLVNFDEDEDESKKDIVKTKDVKKIGTIITEVIGSDNAKKLNWARKCPGGRRERQPMVSLNPPTLLEDSSKFYNDIIKQDENGTYYLNWPKDSNYWFHCEHNENEKFPSPMKRDNYFTPCCFKELKTNNIRDYLTNTTSEVKTQIKFDKNTILLNLGTQGINITEEQLDNEQFVSSIFKQEITQLKNKTSHIINMDKQSNLEQNNFNRLECISLSLEFLLSVNIIVFDEMGSLLLPLNTNYVGNIYYDNTFTNIRYFVRKNDKYIEIIPDDISEEHKTQLIINKKTFIINNTKDNFDFPRISLFESQYLDNFGKCRILKLEGKDIYCQTFIPPLPIINSKELLDKDILIPYSNISHIQNSQLQIVGQYIDDGMCTEVMCRLYNFNVYCNINNTEPLEDIDIYDIKKIIGNNTNIFDTYTKIKKQSNLLKREIINNTTISDDEIVDMVRELSLPESESQLVTNKLKFFRKLYSSKKSVQQNYIEPIYDILSYNKYSNQRILNLSQNIIPKNYSLQLITNYNTPIISINPYFILFDNNIHLVQDTVSISNSCYIHKYWNKFNINYKLNDKFSQCNNYTIYNHEQQPLSIIGDGSNKIIVINSNQPNQKYMTLLPI